MKNISPEDRRTYEEALHISSKGFDNVIFVLSTGSIAITVSFLVGLKDLVIQGLPLLFASWVFISVSIVFHAFSYKESFNHASDALWNEDISEEDLEKRYKHVIPLNDFSFYLAVVGMICLITFAALNIHFMNEQNKEEQNLFNQVEST